jgi:hypothetical protein
MSVQFQGAQRTLDAFQRGVYFPHGACTNTAYYL